MRISCPSCAAAYDVPDALLAGPARTLRCSRCETDFSLPAGPAAEAPPPPPPPEAVVAEPVVPNAPPPEAVVEPAVELPPRDPEPAAPEQPVVPMAERRTALGLAWAVSIVLVLGGVIALFAFRHSVMASWPPATRLFAALGLA